jgi:UDP-N-acetylmuramate dehydrogenase
MKFQENVSLAAYSNYKIGGVARYFFEPKNKREVTWAVREAKTRKLSIFVLGGGTNLLFCDAGFYGLVLKPAMTGIKKSGMTLEAGAGVSMAKLLDYAAAKSLSGLEWAGGLPGTLGGAIRGNAGCFGGEIKDAIVSVRSFNIKSEKIVVRMARACKFGYRESVFKNLVAAGAMGGAAGSGEIILSATLAVARGDKKEIARIVREKIEYRAKNHPLEYPNIGSIFKNVPVPARAGKIKDGVLTFHGSQFSVKTDPFPVISAAKLISESGLRGVSFGGAMISAKHPNFIVNVLNAGAGDVKNLIVLAKAEVKRKFGVALEEEVQVV